MSTFFPKIIGNIKPGDTFLMIVNVPPRNSFRILCLTPGSQTFQLMPYSNYASPATLSVTESSEGYSFSYNGNNVVITQYGTLGYDATAAAQIFPMTSIPYSLKKLSYSAPYSLDHTGQLTLLPDTGDSVVPANFTCASSVQFIPLTWYVYQNGSCIQKGGSAQQAIQDYYTWINSGLLVTAWSDISVCQNASVSYCPATYTCS